MERTKKRLAYDWRFKLYPEGEAPADVYAPEYDDADWETVKVPHDWAISAEFDMYNDSSHSPIVQDGIEIPVQHSGRTGGLPIIGLGVYRLSLDIPADACGQKLFLEFDGVMWDSDVYVNGKHAFFNHFGYKSFCVDMTDLAECGKTNTIAVAARVYHDCSRWYPGAGIYRNVYLVQKAPVHIAYDGVWVRQLEVANGCAKFLLTLDYCGPETVSFHADILDPAGNTVIDTAAAFTYTEGGIAFWKWLLSPVLVLGAAGSGTLVAVIVFLLVIGGVFTCLDRCGLMKYMLHKTAGRFSAVRYRLLAVVLLIFMGMGTMIGSFEECVPLVPIMVALAVDLGWDVMTGIGMSLLAAGCGFAAGVCNPFTVGVAQELAGLPMFSGAWLRMLSFVLIYLLLYGFLYRHAKKIEKPLEAVRSGVTFVPDLKMDRGLRCFVGIMGAGMALVLSSGFIPALQDYTMVIVAVMFLAAGLCSCRLCGMEGRDMGKQFVSGVSGILPAVLMILMASSIRYTMEEARILDTILHEAVVLARRLPGWTVILFIYLVVLVMNFFIPSGSAKAFMLIPLIVPLAQVFGLSPQLCVVAFAFGDGFSNVFYPTNPALLIALGLADVNYADWFRWSGKFQILNLILTSLILIFGLAIGY